MANTVTNNRVDQSLYLQMSNGATSVFISLLSMACSVLAETEGEVRISVFFASRDQGVFGSGCVGFDISDIPFTSSTDEFESEKKFIMSAVDRVMTQKDWNKLDYEPDYDRVCENQKLFRKMIERFSIDEAQNLRSDLFYMPEKKGEKCIKHSSYLHIGGCVVCNDM